MRNEVFTFAGGFVAGICFIFAAWAAIDLGFLDGSSFCDKNEPRLVCARNWANAIAIVTAAGTIFLILKQVSEQSKQTAFLLGDAKPTFDVYSDKLPVVYFRIVNWNRRTLIVDSIRSSDLLGVSILEARLEHKNEKLNLSNDSAIFDRPIRVAAYDNRSEAPAILRLDGIAFGGGPKRKAATFELRGRLLGERHEEVKLVATSVVVQLQ